ncbi:MAG TPA: Maf family protein [Lacipirellulaceae bacterium]|jgi:septum formation protein|nr:Maf family protein [Lacipirellulaceae bacterium]
MEPALTSKTNSLPPLVLASGSPRRRELLEQAGYVFTVVPANEDVECGVCSESGPAGLVTDLAFRKAAAVRQQLLAGEISKLLDPQTIILAADTVADLDGFVLGKPRDESHARAMLSQLSGRDHRVLTGVCLWPLNVGTPLIKMAVTKLRMDSLSDEQLDEYLDSGQWEGKAGSFGYQDRLGWVHIVEGSESNVVGLPMELLAEMLAELSG